MFTEDQVESIIDLLSTSDKHKIYFGCDSSAYKKGRNPDGSPIWYAKFATVLVVHLNGKNGCKIFRHIDHERVHDSKKSRPFDRMMKETYRVSALWSQFSGLIDGYHTEIHLDINPDTKHGSSCAITAATGYILGTTGITPHVKPDAWAASFGADGVGRGFDKRGTSYSTIH